MAAQRAAALAGTAGGLDAASPPPARAIVRVIALC
jgi:hypothetical protein